MYACQIWGQSSNTLNKIQPLQDKAVRIINFKPDNHNVGELYKRDKILKVSDYIKLLNSLFVRDVLLNSSIPPFKISLLNQKICTNITPDMPSMTLSY